MIVLQNIINSVRFMCTLARHSD